MSLFAFLGKKPAPPSPIDESEKLLLATRAFSAIWLTALAHRTNPYFDEPIDPLDPVRWHELSARVNEPVSSLVLACAYVRSTLETGTLDDLRKVCSATNHAAHKAWPKEPIGEFRARSGLTPDDRTIAEWLSRGRTEGALSGFALVRRAEAILAPELELVRAPRLETDDDDGAILCNAIVGLLGAEWKLFAAGHVREGQRVGIARAFVGVAVASEWSEQYRLHPPALVAADGAMAYLERSGA